MVAQIKMTLHISLTLLGMLCSQAAGLICNMCIPNASGLCTETNVSCPEGVCSGVTAGAYTAGVKLHGTAIRNCVPFDQCLNASVNFGIAKIVLNTNCCSTDNCNTKMPPEVTLNTPNGNRCFTCNEDCYETLTCVGDEDHCIKANTNENGQKIPLKGCATSTVCQGKMADQLQDLAFGLECCKGDLCNSAWRTSGSSLAPLLGSLTCGLFLLRHLLH
ncbi:phospholipase A2 inhibitor and Ly6/PLAUR domain-containing protein-like [Alosa sapidissima]|uniref:phospholipase A2 inhibitor and Ly6/PLAUR domain-containing protein-like n=1 Tax=Alosa sapidissima TaxID=34773 RepID=UPI001C09F5DF|nr:phospholipase A2 inhibitor and Ly6/PLAUR domain-containing protein-like [Alosa sapidissima]